MDKTLIAALIGSASSLLGVWLKHYLDTSSQRAKATIQERKIFVPTAQVLEQQVISPAANISLVCGILSILLGGFTAVPAIVAGHMALKQIRVSNGRVAGTKRAVTGFVVGYSVAGLLLVFIIIGSLTGF